MKKFMIVTCMMAMMLVGCSSEKKEYVRDTSAGKMEETTLDEVYKQFENKEDFVLLITFTFCSHCQDLKAVLEPYLQTHNVVVKELVMDKLVPTNDEYDEAKEKLNTYLKDYEGTPSFYYIEDGKKKDEIIGFGGTGNDVINIDTYDAFIQKYQIDAK